MSKNAPWRCSCNAQFRSFDAALQHVSDTHGKRADARYGIYRRVATVTAQDADAMLKEHVTPSEVAPWGDE